MSLVSYVKQQQIAIPASPLYRKMEDKDMMLLPKEITRVIEKSKRKSDKSSTIYSVRSCPRNTEVTIVGEDDKGRKFCRVVCCPNVVRKID